MARRLERLSDVLNVTAR
jgi:hypothetical protein